MMKHKIFLLFLCVPLVLSCFSMLAFAEEPDEAPPTVNTTDPVIEQRKQDILGSKTETIISFTTDSVCSEGIHLEPYLDQFAYLVYTHIITSDLPVGYQIYDDPNTDIIDGIRVNGETVTSLRMIPVDPTSDKIEILVKTVYKNNLLGDLAKLSDGNYTLDDLVKSPLLTLQVAYYLFLIISVLVAIFTGMRSKKKKVKTADEIAAAVNVSAASVNKATEDSKLIIADMVKDVISESILPLIQKTLETNQSIVKAIAVSNSKSKEAPLALLDIFKDITDTDTAKLITEAKNSVEKSLTKDAENKKQLLSALKNIAEPTQEENSNVQKIKGQTEKKSVF